MKKNFKRDFDFDEDDEEYETEIKLRKDKRGKKSYKTIDKVDGFDEKRSKINRKMRD
ncbi:MAG: hypothetical protein HQK91_07470 [Nitrospirae bacterium]|nr:hypothetical protein [Nitrospirota bacterium]